MINRSFTKLFASITDSSIWSAPDHIVKVWITMLAMADECGLVDATIPGLAARARHTIEVIEEALGYLKAPDPYSRTKDFGGRRIADVPGGGWLLLNHEKYRQTVMKEAGRQSKREWAQRAREKLAADLEQAESPTPATQIDSARVVSVSVDPSGSRSDPDPDPTRAREAAPTENHDSARLGLSTPRGVIDPPPPPTPGVFDAPTLGRASTVAPDDFEPTAAHTVRCKELRIDIGAELKSFKLFEFSRPYSNWNLRFSRWIEDARIRAETERGKRTRSPRDRPNQPNCGLTGFEGAREFR